MNLLLITLGSLALLALVAALVSDSYNDDEVQHFADVLFSLRPEDARGWARSLSLREINLPDALKDDLFALIEG